MNFIQSVLKFVLSLTMPMFTVVALAGETDEERQLLNFNLYFENDLFGETDQNYTNGIRASFTTPDLVDFESSEHPTISWLSDKLDFLHPRIDKCDICPGKNNNIIFTIGQTMYTPVTIDATELLVDERPYAGWLFAGLGFHTRSKYSLNSYEIQLGMIGPGALGKEAQDWIHDLRGFDKFQGWHNQLRDEPAFNIIYEHKTKFTLLETDNGLASEFIGHAGWSLGTVATYVNAGGELRLGWHLPNDFGTSAVRPGGDNSAPNSDWHRQKQWGVHFFASMDNRYVFRDIFLDGNTFKNSHSVDKEKLVADVATGISITYDYFKISYAHVFRSKEFTLQPHSHNYGSLSFSIWGLF